MKKILTAIPVLLLLCAGSVSAQSSPASAAKVMTVEEANRLNGTAQPTINGIPYSQYKAQQDALKLKQANEPKMATTASTAQTAPRSSVYQQPETAVTAKPVIAKAETIAEPTAPSRLQGITATSKDQPALTGQQPVTSTAVETKVKPAADNIDKTIPGTLVQAPALTLSSATVADAQHAAPANAVKMPELKQTQDAQKAEAEIPASVAPAPVKKPAITQQGSGN